MAVSGPVISDAASSMVGAAPRRRNSEHTELTSTDVDEWEEPATDDGGGVGDGTTLLRGRMTVSVYFMCKAGVGPFTCNTAVSGGSFKRLHGGTSWRLLSSWYCPVCDAMYLTKWGVLVEIHDTDLGFVRYQYGKACLPPQNIMDLMHRPLEQFQRGVNLLPPGTLHNAIQATRPLRDGRLGTELTTGVYRLGANYDGLPEVDWLRLLDRLARSPDEPDVR